MPKRLNHIPVYFFTPYGDYGIFSNFYPITMIIDGRAYKTVEHYFQSQKTLSYLEQEMIRTAETPRDAKRLGKSVSLRENWEEIKEEVMMTALRAKARSSVKFRDLLLSTGNREIVENSPYDAYWGTGRNGYGKNRMGKLLMQLRKELRNEQLNL